MGSLRSPQGRWKLQSCLEEENQNRNQRWAGLEERFQLKNRILERKDLDKKLYDVRDLYFDTGCIQCIARSEPFANLTLAVISLNAVYIGIDVDRITRKSAHEAVLHFRIADNVFCCFFFIRMACALLFFQTEIKLPSGRVVQV